MEQPLKRVNVGCGQRPVRGWLNYDNSPSVWLSRHRVIVAILERLGLLKEGSRNFISFARDSDILWADATNRIPLPDSSVEVLYASHVVEHLDRSEIRRFLEEAHRVLAPSGIIRIAVPDLRKLVDQYVTSGDADAFVESTLLTVEQPKTVLGRVKHLIVGNRHHLWMYDGKSMCQVLLAHGFSSPRILDPGASKIATPGGLDLCERADTSVYIEASKDLMSEQGQTLH